MTKPADQYIHKLLAAEARRCSQEQRRREQDAHAALAIIQQMNLRSSKERRS